MTTENENTQVAVARPQSVKDFLAVPAYKERFHEVLQKRAPQFMAAIVQTAAQPHLKDAEPRSIIAGAMVAATLDLPINQTLGMAHLVPYRDSSGQLVAQFQCGYKGFIQLALRSGQYRRLNAGSVSEGVFQGYDKVGEPIMDFSRNDPVAPAAGYYCAFETVNGFTKIVYWTKAQVEAHARRFSKAFSKGFKSSPWFSDFDSMATKTVIKSALTKWGIMSVEMQQVAVHDQGVQLDVDAEVRHVDAEPLVPQGEGETTPPKRPPPPPRKPKGVEAMKVATPVAEPETVKEPEQEPEAEPESAPEPESQPAPQPEPAKKKAAVVQRTTLNDGEVITVEAMVDSFKKASGSRGGKPHPYISASVVSPQFRGDVNQPDGGLDQDGSPVKEWQLDNPVLLTLRGKKYPNHPGVVVLVDKIEESVAY